jgi:hypothetical protein
MFEMRPAVIAPRCPDCGDAVCTCYQRAMGTYREPAVLIRSTPKWEDGIQLEGIATSKGWDGVEVPRAVRTADGGATYRRAGRDPLRMKGHLPQPLLLGHDRRQQVGEVCELSVDADGDVVRFRAVVAPVETPGYDRGLLESVWADLRAGGLRCVSYATYRVRADGSWEGRELSLAERGAHPFAVVTRVAFPDGSGGEALEPVVDHDVVRAACDKFYAEHAARRASLERSTPDTETAAALPPLTLADTYAGTWAAGQQFERGQTVAWDKSWWLSMRRNIDCRPGGSDAWRLLAGRGRDGRDRR